MNEEGGGPKLVVIGLRVLDEDHRTAFLQGQMQRTHLTARDPIYRGSRMNLIFGRSSVKFATCLVTQTEKTE
jgi:hypothetical protein